MKVLKNPVSKERKCQFGDFELVPEEGWKISQTFIDYESGLLVVRESDENRDHWINTGYGSRTIPVNEYKIDRSTGKVLPFLEWSKFFSYERKELVSEDAKYKLITVRAYEPERDSDGIKEELIELETGKVISSSDSVAFREEKRETLLESFYRRARENEEQEVKLNAMPTLRQFYERELEKLQTGDIILDFYSSDCIYKLSYNGVIFELKRVNEKWTYDFERRSLHYEGFEQFGTIEDFRTRYLENKSWYLDHTPFKRNNAGALVNQLLKRFVVEYLNTLRENLDFTYKEYNKLKDWEVFFYQPDAVRPSEYKQYCSNCRKSVVYYPRYPKYICVECSSKKVTDEKGNELEFSNLGVSGGFRITYKKDSVIFSEDTSQTKKLCFIDEKRYIAAEAKFGGIVIQAQE